MAFIRIGKSLLWGVIFEIIMHVWNFHTRYVFLDSSFVIKKSNKCYYLNLISKHTIRNTTFTRRHSNQ
jgi:TRAP-type mannitol/chloroaromatic compound transport system permease small subunit